jgi:putative proteasome-type protease
MTYCVGIVLKEGLVFASDSRTHAGVDNFAKFCKMTVFERAGDRVLVLLSSGNLAGTQAVISVLKQRSEVTEGPPTLWTARTMFYVAVLVSDAVRDIERRDAPFPESGPISFNASFLVGGQLKGEPPRLFRIYAESNFIEAGDETPFLQTGDAHVGF